uniref:Glycosyltransferase family 1 protein n=1 Tax=Eptatretus burgeri TaxID=7764 RepID=A0A8C4X0Z4_EPTBU
MPAPWLDQGAGGAGGQNVYLHHVAQGLVKEGWQVDVFTRRTTIKQEGVVDTAFGYRVVNVTAGPEELIPREKIYEHLHKFLFEVLRYQKEHGICYPIVHTNYWLSAWVGLKLHKIQGSLQVHTFHSLASIKFKGKSDLDEMDTIRISVEKEVLEKANSIVSTSPEEVKHLKKMTSALDNVSIISCGTDQRLFGTMDRTTARMFLNVPLDTKVLLYVGRLDPRKGIETLLQAVKNLISEQLNLLVLIVGGAVAGHEDSVELKRLKNIVLKLNLKDVIKFEGLVEHGMLKHYYAAANMLVVPSIYEPFGMVAVEAMASRIPVVASDVGGLRYIVVSGETGYVCPPSDHGAFSKAIDFILSNPKWGEEAGRKGRKRVEQHFTWDNVASKLNDLYKMLLEKYKKYRISAASELGFRTATRQVWHFRTEPIQAGFGK